MDFLIPYDSTSRITSVYRGDVLSVSLSSSGSVSTHFKMGQKDAVSRHQAYVEWLGQLRTKQFITLNVYDAGIVHM